MLRKLFFKHMLQIVVQMVFLLLRSWELVKQIEVQASTILDFQNQNMIGMQ